MVSEIIGAEEKIPAKASSTGHLCELLIGAKEKEIEFSGVVEWTEDSRGHEEGRFNMKVDYFPDYAIYELSSVESPEAKPYRFSTRPREWSLRNVSLGENDSVVAVMGFLHGKKRRIMYIYCQ